jgi:predicted nucleotidyltransferase
MLEQLFSSRARIAILRLFLLNPEERFYVREAATLTDQPRRAVQRELRKLEGIGLLEHTVDGNRKYYQVNNGCPIFPELKSMFLKTVGLGDVLREYLAEKAKAIEVAFIFGSYASGEEKAASDIDLFVIGSISSRELSGVLAQAQRDLRREINQVVMSVDEFQVKVGDNNHVVLSVLDEPKVFLLGDETDLARIARRPISVGGAQALREKILPILLPYAVERVSLFGSIVRGDATTESDVDILVAFRDPVGLLALARLRRELSERLGRQVDLVTEGSLSRHMRPGVEREKVVLYEG